MEKYIAHKYNRIAGFCVYAKNEKEATARAAKNEHCLESAIEIKKAIIQNEPIYITS